MILEFFLGGSIRKVLGAVYEIIELIMRRMLLYLLQYLMYFL